MIKIESKKEFYSDPHRLEVIISNLLSNSIKYHDSTIAKPTIEFIVTDLEGGINISCSDNGVGIKPENQDKVFDMFYRASAKSKGSGIGLYIVKEIVGKMKGKIRLESKFHEGTIVNIFLPRIS